MDIKIILLKSIQLVFRDSQLGNKDDHSRAVVRELLGDIPVMENTGVSDERDVVNKLRSFLVEVLAVAEEGPMTPDYVLDTLRLILVNDDNMLCLLEPMFAEKLNDLALKSLVIATRRSLSRFNNEKQIKKVLSDAHYKWNFQRDKITDISSFIDDHITALENFRVDTEKKDPGVISRYQLSNLSDLSRLVAKSTARSSTSTGLITGLQDMNKMIGGYFIRGTCVFVNALPHMNKTGTCAGFFVDFCTLNKPSRDPTGKARIPCHIWYSFEDEPELAIKRIYLRLKYDETREYVPVPKRPDEDEEDFENKLANYNMVIDRMSKYVHEKLSVNGFATFIVRVNPDLWTYRDLMNDIIRLESEGYEIYSCITDYMMKLNRAGCKGDGTAGSDMRELVTKMKNFFATKGILWVNPHQLSSEALKLIRASTNPDKFPQEIAGMGYLDGSTRLHQDYDLEITQHIFYFNNSPYIAYARGKNREGEALPPEDKYFVVPMPARGMPIPTDINSNQKLSYKRLLDAVRAKSNEAKQEKEEMMDF